MLDPTAYAAAEQYERRWEQLTVDPELVPFYIPLSRSGLEELLINAAAAELIDPEPPEVP